MTKIAFDGCYKGGRNYLHGTDIYNGAQKGAEELFGENSYVSSLIIRNVARSRGAFFIREDYLPEGYVETAQLKINTGSEQVGGVFATDGTPVTQEKEYEENLVMNNAIIDEENSMITQLSKTDFTTIEEVVALTKFIHNCTLLPAQGQWMFTMIDLKKKMLQHNENLLSVRLKQNLGGKMTRSELLIKNEVVGTIGFTVL